MQVNNSSNSEYNMRIWRGAINADKHARYYSYRANAMKLWSMGLTFVVLISSSGAILSLMGVWNMVLLSTILYAIVALATIVNFVYDFSFQAAAALIIRNQCRLLAVEWEKIWIRRNDHDMGGKIDELEYRLESITQGEMLVNEKLNDKLEGESNDITRKRLTLREQPSQEA